MLKLIIDILRYFFGKPSSVPDLPDVPHPVEQALNAEQGPPHLPDLNEDGIELIKSFESCKLTAYRDIIGKWTIGWGYAGLEVSSGMVWNQAQADSQLNTSLLEFSKQVESTIGTRFPLTDNQFSALVSFCYNCGSANLKTLVAGSDNVEHLGERITLYNKARISGELVVVAGLARRRQAEQALFRRPL